MFTIEATIEKIYHLSAEKQKLFEFFSDPTNFATYMPEIIHSVVVKNNDHSLWTIKVELTSSSSITVKLDMVKKIVGSGLVKYTPAKETQDYLGINVKLTEKQNVTDVDFSLDIKLERSSGFEIHSLAPFLGERAINKLVASQGQDHVDGFIKKAEKQTHKK